MMIHPGWFTLGWLDLFDLWPEDGEAFVALVDDLVRTVAE
jgi:hypothetical protein